MLAYDVVFILNRFFTELSDSLRDSHGHYAQFAGDGLMALYGLDPDRIVCGNGSDELIQIILLALARPGSYVLVPRPTFGMYETRQYSQLSQTLLLNFLVWWQKG